MKYLQLCAIGLLSLWASSASADYLCKVEYSPPESGTFGSSGNVAFTYTTGADQSLCYPETNNYKYFCTTGATATSCSNRRLYDQYAISALFSRMVEAVRTGERVVVDLNGAICFGGGSGCPMGIIFYSK